MNFVTVTVNKKADGVYVDFGNVSLKLPEAKANSDKLAPYIGKEVLLGIRPEDIHDEPAMIAANEASTTDAFVEVTEMMGAETYLYLKIADIPFVSRVSQRSTTKADETVKVAFDMNRAHLFDKETEMAIIH